MVTVVLLLIQTLFLQKKKIKEINKKNQHLFLNLSIKGILHKVEQEKNLHFWRKKFILLPFFIDQNFLKPGKNHLKPGLPGLGRPEVLDGLVEI